MERAIPTNLNPKSPTFKDRNASFSSPHLTPDQPNKSEPHHAMRPNNGLIRALDHDPTSDQLSTFGAHKYFNQGTIFNDNIQKVSINSNSRVSPLLNMDTEHKPNPEQGDITKSTRSFSYSASSSVGGNKGNYNNNINNNYKAHSFHVATPTPPPSSSKSTLNNKAGLLFHHPQTSKISVKPPQASSSLTKKLRTSLSKPIWLLRRKCPCNDKKSVQVKGNTNKKNTPKPKTPPPQPQTLSHNQIHKDSLNHKAPPTTTAPSNKEVKSQRLFQFQPSMNQVRRPSSEAFTFPLFLATNNSTNPTKPHHHQVLLNVVHEEEDTTPRESLHLFQPPSPTKSRAMDDDAASDASSDLFEIESFSTQTSTLPYPIITPSSIAQCHETTDHDQFFFAADAGSSLWRRRWLRDTEVLPPL